LYFLQSAEAEEYAKNTGVMGGRAPVQEREAYVFSVNSKVIGYVLTDDLITPDRLGLTSQQAKIQKALKKLTPEERSLLGF